MYQVQRNYCSTGKFKLKRADILNMEHYSCSKVMQSNTATKGREKSQPLRLKELYKSPDIPKSGKKGLVREKSKPERLTLAFSGIKNTETVSASEGSSLGESDTYSESGLRGRSVRRKLNLSFATPNCSANSKKSMYISKTTNKAVQQINTFTNSKSENCQPKKMISNKGRTSFLMPPNTLKNKYLSKQTEKEKDSTDATNSDERFSPNYQQRYSTVREERRTSNTDLQKPISKSRVDQEAITKETEKSEINNKNLKDAEIFVTKTNHIDNSKYRISSVQTIPARKQNNGCADLNMSGVHSMQNQNSQVTDLNLVLCINIMSALGQPGNNNSYKCEVQNAAVDTTSVKHSSHDDCKRIHPLKADVATVKSNLTNLIRTTEESLAQLKVTLSCIENLLPREEDTPTETMLTSDKDDQVVNNDESTFVSTESTVDYIKPKLSTVKEDKAVQTETNTSNDDCLDNSSCFEIISDKDSQNTSLNDCEKVLSLECIDQCQTENNSENKENYEKTASTDKLEERREIKSVVGNLVRESHSDSFLALESELNILHLRPHTSNYSISEDIEKTNRKKVIACNGRLDKSVKEYMLLKSDLNCLETPNVKKFRSLSYRDTKSVPSSMHKTYMSSKVLAELQNLYTDSPEL